MPQYLVIKDRLKKLFTFDVTFYQVLDEKSNKKIEKMISAVLRLRENWNELKKDFVVNPSIFKSFKIGDFNSRIGKFLDDLDLDFMNIKREQQEVLKDTGIPLLIFFFLYLTRVRTFIMKNDNSTKECLMRLSLRILFISFKNAEKNP